MADPNSQMNGIQKSTRVMNSNRHVTRLTSASTGVPADRPNLFQPLKVCSQRLACLILLASLLVTGCKEEAVEPDDWFPLRIGSVSLSAQFAIDQATQARGLMFREALGENQGMLFIASRPRKHSFWMRNTLIPLDIGYFTEDGVLREIYPMFPRDENHVVSRRDDIFFALEMNRGWYRENGIKVGAQLNLEDVRKADQALKRIGH